MLAGGKVSRAEPGRADQLLAGRWHIRHNQVARRRQSCNWQMCECAAIFASVSRICFCQVLNCELASLPAALVYLHDGGIKQLAAELRNGKSNQGSG